MTQAKKHTLLWLAAGLLCSLLALLVVWTGLSGKVWITDPEGIPEAADAVMNSIRTGDWAGLTDMVLGSPALTPPAADADSAESRIWEAYRKSLQWTCAESFGVQDSSITQKVSVTCLDIPGVTDAISKILSDSGSDGFDTASQTELLRRAATQVLESQVPMLRREITLTFQREQGRWMLVPNHALLTLLSGFTVR